MKKWLSYIISVVITCLCYSCSGDEVVTGTDHNGSGNNEGIVIRLGITSRADGITVGDTDNKAITNLKVWMVHEEDDKFSFYKEIDDADGIDFGTDDIYNFTMEISVVKPGDYGVYILASSNNLSGGKFNKNTKPKDLKAAYFTAISGGNTAEAESSIPMYGDYHSVNIVGDKHTYEVQVPLVRVLSKLELFFAKTEEKSQLEITSLVLGNIPDRGYIVPTTDWTDVTYKGTATLLDSPVVITGHSADFTHANFQQVSINQPYIFENPNGGVDAALGSAEGNAYQLTINYKLGGSGQEEESQVIALPAIMRNTKYQLYVKALEKGVELKVNIADWNKYESHIGWNPSTDDYKFGMWEGNDYEANNKGVSWPCQSGGKEKDDTSFANYQFKLTAPKGAVWTATLTNGLDFKFGKSGSTSDHYIATQGIAREEWYEIKVGCTKPWDGTEKETLLYITVDGEKLKINPEKKFAGDEYNILIKQIWDTRLD